MTVGILLGGREITNAANIASTGRQNLDRTFGPGSENPKDQEDQLATDTRQRAEEDVRKALGGDQAAAKRIDDVLESLNAKQRSGAEDLTSTQGSYLSQLNAQTNGMSAQELATAERRLGDYKRIMGDSWQLMSSDDIEFPRTDTTVGALDDPSQIIKGGFGQLPQSVQENMRSAQSTIGDGTASYLTKHTDLRAIADIIGDGQSKYQTGTELDREMIRAADHMMDVPDLATADTVQISSSHQGAIIRSSTTTSWVLMVTMATIFCTT